MPTLHLSVYWTKDADPYMSRTVTIFRETRNLFSRYGFELEVLPRGVNEVVIDKWDFVFTKEENAAGDGRLVRKSNDEIRPIMDKAAICADNRLAVLFGKLEDKVTDPLGTLVGDPSAYGYIWWGHTIRSTNFIQSQYKPWVVVDPKCSDFVPAVLVHEMGHAAGVHHVTDLGQITDVMYQYPTPKSTDMSDGLKNALAGSFFCW